MVSGFGGDVCRPPPPSAGHTSKRFLEMHDECVHISMEGSRAQHSHTLSLLSCFTPRPSEEAC